MKKKSLMKKMLPCIAAGMFVGCTSSDNPVKDDTSSIKDGADLVVFGKIFTSDDNKIVEAFAVKDGKYVYVGNKAGAEAYVEKGKTEVVD